jgi:hypothetical protein
MLIDCPLVAKRRLAVLLIDVIHGDVDDPAAAIALLRLLLSILEEGETRQGATNPERCESSRPPAPSS